MELNPKQSRIKYIHQYLFIFMVSPKNTNHSMYILSCVMCVFSGFILRICLEYTKETFTKKYLILRTLITSCVSFISTIVYRDYHTKIGISIELYLFIIGFFAGFLISLFDKFAQIGFKEYSKILLKRLLAYAETDEKQVKKHGNDR